jgi:transcription elongation GreA/GreB family factor
VWPHALFGQTTTGQISGSSVDASGQVLVGATVTLRNEGTRDARVTTTNLVEDGSRS